MGKPRSSRPCMVPYTIESSDLGDYLSVHGVISQSCQPLSSCAALATSSHSLAIPEGFRVFEEGSMARRRTQAVVLSLVRSLEIPHVQESPAILTH